MKTFDAAGQIISDSVFAEAYRATIPLLADAKHVTIRMTSNRFKELGKMEQDLSDVVEVGDFSEKRLDGSLKSVTRIIAVPVTVHPQDGAELVIDESADPTKVQFCINGIPEVEIVNLALNSQEVADKAANDKAAADEAAVADAQVKATQLEQAKKEAFEEGRKQALLEQAMEAGMASVKDTGTVQ